MALSFKMVRNIGLSVMVLIIIGMGLFYLAFTGKIARSLSVVMKRERPKLEMTDHIRKQFADAKDIVIAYTREEETDITPAVLIMDEVIKQSMALKEAVTEEEKEVVAAFITAAKRFKVAAVTYGEECETDVTGAAALDMEKVAITTAKEANEALVKMVCDIRGRIKAAEEAMLSMSKSNQKLTSVGMLLGLVSALLVAFFMGRGLSMPLRKLTTAADRASREGDLTQRVEVKGKDEIARLGRAFNKLIESLRSTVTEREAVAKIGRIIGSTLEIEKVYEHFAEEVRKIIPFDRIAINLIYPERDAYASAYIAGVDVAGHRPGNVVPLAGSLTGEVVRTKSSLLIQTEDRDEVVSRFPRLMPNFQAGLRSLIAVSLISKDQVIGVLHVQSTKQKGYTEADENLAESIGAQIAGAIANAQLYAERKRADEALQREKHSVQRLAEEREAVAKIGRIIGSTLEIEEVYKHFAEEVRKIIPFDRIAISLVYPEKGTFLTAHITGKEVPGYRSGDVAPMAGSLTEEVVRTWSGQLIQTEDRDEVAGRVPGLLAEFQVGLRSCMAVPLISTDQIIGVLHLQSAKLNAYTEADVSLAESISAQIAGAIANAQLYEETKRAQKELKESERRFQDVALSSADWIWEVDRKARYTYASGKVKEILGYDPEEIIGKTPFELMSKEEGDHIGEVFKKIASEKKPIIDLENWNLTKEGREICLLTNGVPILGEKGELLGYRGVDKDITERKRGEEALRTSEERFALAVQGTNEGLWDWDIVNNSLYWSPRLKELLGYADEELDPNLDNFLEEILHPDDRERIGAAIDAHLKDREPYYVEQRQLTKSGEYRWFMVRGKALWDEAGNPIRMVGSTTDITDRKQAEEALRASEERFTLAVRGTNDGIWDWDIQNNTLYWSPRLKELIGYADDELHVDFDTFESHLHPDNRKDTAAAIEAHLKDRVPYDVEQRMRTKSGKYRWVQVRGQAIRDEAGNPIRMVGFSTDITERKRAEEKVKNANRRLIREMREREEFLRVVSHDLGAPVRNISGMAASIIRKHGENIGDEARDRLARIQRNAEHELGMIQDLLELSRIKTRRGRFEEVDLGALVKGVGDGLSYQLEEKGITLEIADGLPAVICERKRMMQVFQNLIDNACKYMDSNKNPRIEVGFEELEDSYRFSVSDNGIGIREEDQERIFYVFNRLKNPTTSQVEGKGVGLSAVKAVVEAYGGEVWVESPSKCPRRGKGARGSTFYFTLAKDMLRGRNG